MAEQLNAALFESWQHYEVQGEKLEVAGLPFADSFLADHFPAIIADELVAAEPATTPLGCTSEFHARSYEVQLGKRNEADNFLLSAVWQDAHGNQFTSLNIKGNNFTEQKIIESLTAPSGYIPFGLQESDALLRVIRASNIMRAAGIDTEWPVRLLEPKTLMFDEERVQQAEYRKRLVDKVLHEAVDVDKAAETAQAVKDMTFFVTVRAMKILDRPYDFLYDKHKADAINRLERIFAIHNSLLDTTKSDERRLDPLNNEDIKHYFTEYLPAQVGQNLAKLHETGLKHTYPYPGNVNALGGLVDLDSVKGEPLGLGDAKITPKDWADDVRFFLLRDDDGAAYEEVLGHLHRLGFDIGFDVSDSEDNLVRAYCAARGFDTVTTENAKQVLEFSLRLEEGTHITGASFMLGDALDVLLEDGPESDTLAQLESVFNFEEVVTMCVKELSDQSLIDRYVGGAVDDVFSMAGREKMIFDQAAVDELAAEATLRAMARLNTQMAQGFDQAWQDEAVQAGFKNWIKQLGLEENEQMILEGLREVSLDVWMIRCVGSEELRGIVKASLHRYNEHFEPSRFSDPRVSSFAQVIADSEPLEQVIFGKRRTVCDYVPIEDFLSGLPNSDEPQQKLSFLTVFVDSNAESIEISDIVRDEKCGDPRIIFSSGDCGLVFNEETKKLSWKSTDTTYVGFLSEPDENGVVHIVLAYKGAMSDYLPLLKTSGQNQQAKQAHIRGTVQQAIRAHVSFDISEIDEALKAESNLEN